MIAFRSRRFQRPSWEPANFLQRIGSSQVSNAARFVWQLRDLLKNLLSDKQHIVLKRLHKTFGDRFRIHFGFHTLVILSDPVAVKQVLEMDSESMSAGAGRKRLVGMFPEQSLFYAEGAKHKQMRRDVSQAFGEAAKTFDLDHHLQKLVQQVQQSESQDPFDVICEQFTVLTAYFVMGKADPKLCQLTAKMLSCFSQIHNAAIVVPPLKNTRHFGEGLRNYQVAQTTFVNYFQQLIEKPGGFKTDSLLGTLKQKQYAGHMTAQEVRDNAAFFFLVITRTMASLFSNVAQTLAVETEWQDRLRNMDSAAAPQGNLHRAVIKETMRLVPFAPMFARVAMADKEVDGFQIKKGELVIISPSIIHLREDAFPNPLKFDPTRFTGSKQYGYNYIPFGGGRHHCIGSGWLVDSLTSIFRHLLPVLEFHSENGRPQDNDYSMRAVFLMPRSRTFSIRRIQHTQSTNGRLESTDFRPNSNASAV